MRIKQIFESTQTKTVYHVTIASNLSSIKKNGLHPQIGPNSQMLGEKVKAIHVFYDMDTLEDAVGNWEMSWDEDEELVCIILQVPQSWVTDDPAYPNTVGLVKQDIPPNMIKKIKRNI